MVAEEPNFIQVKGYILFQGEVIKNCGKFHGIWIFFQ